MLTGFLGTPINLKGVVNAREYGGYETRLGMIKPGLILRGGELSNLLPEGKEILAHEYHLKKILDLRSLSEIIKRPDQEIEGVKNIHLDVIGNTFDFSGDPRDMAREPGARSPEEHMRELYSSFTTNPIPLNALKQFFREVLDLDEGSFYVHCTAGKDRTGIASALLLYVLGASEELIYHDYVLSNHYRKEFMEKEIEEINSNLQTRMSGQEEGYFRILHTVHERYLLVSLEEAKKIHGSLDQFLHDALDITPEKKEYLRDRYLIRK